MKNPPPEDLSALLGLNGTAARIVLVLFWATFLSMALLSGGTAMTNPLSVVALVITLGSAALIIWPGPDPLPWASTAVVVVGAAVSSTIVVWQLDPSEAPSYSSWNFGADTFLMFGLAMRGRIGGAWIGMGLVVATTLTWSVTMTGDPLLGIIYAYQHPVLLVAGSFFAIGLRRTAGRTREFRAIERMRIADEQALEVGSAWRRDAIERIRGLAGPALSAIADGEPTPAERQEHRLLEATLRDLLRARRLAVEPLQGVVRTARAAGGEIVLLDDLGDLSPEPDALRRAVTWAAERVTELSGSAAGTITVRLAPREGAATVTVAADEQTTAPEQRAVT
jgi:hypothetical protein